MSTDNKIDKAKAIRCSINVQKMPITRFEMLFDRTGGKSARSRRAILEQIASKANADGTGSYVSDSYIASKTLFTEEYILKKRKDLRTLGLLDWADARGFRGEEKGWGSNFYTVSTTEDWPRRNVIKKIFKLNPELLEDLNPELSGVESQSFGGESRTVKAKNESNPELSELNPELISSDNRPSVPPLKPTALPTATEKDLDWVVGFFVNQFGQGVDKNKIALLFEGRKPKAVKGTIEKWRNDRRQGFEGLNNPFGALEREIDGFYDSTLETSEDIEMRMQAELAREQADLAHEEAIRAAEPKLTPEQAWEIEQAL